MEMNQETAAGMKNRYTTKDLYEAALIYAKGEQFGGIEPNGSHYLFVFRNKKDCEVMAGSYWQGKCLVNAKAYSDAIRTLKDLIFSRR